LHKFESALGAISLGGSLILQIEGGFMTAQSERMFKTLAEVKAANKAIGNHWFERSTMRFFNSKVETGLLRGRFFITSERMELTFPKRYTVREAMPDGDIKTVGEFQGYTDLELARMAVNIVSTLNP